MSVLIKGMEMPDHCWECWLMRNMTCGACGEMIPVTGKRNHCPLVALPDKHGRLIDADELTELCDIMADKCGGIGESIWGQFRATVEWSPTIIEAEE